LNGYKNHWHNLEEEIRSVVTIPSAAMMMPISEKMASLDHEDEAWLVLGWGGGAGIAWATRA
jgi:hypothetical protein